MTACQNVPSPDIHMLGMSESRNLSIEVHVYMYIVEVTSGLCGLWTSCEEKVQMAPACCDVCFSSHSVCVCLETGRRGGGGGGGQKGGRFFLTMETLCVS